MYPFEVYIKASNETGLKKDSKIACDQVRSLDKRRLTKKIGSVNLKAMEKIKTALRLHFNL
ncbi:MAG: type II toxin-antitoxin system PemK/MazF family toxin [Spirochaetes bacterium]|nr:type II toxin-antitoxin system PemK/MazF family toxin [Spirochaetota bacterium]